ncbi:hypothetical protein, partial [Mycolicibacterium iranicum]
RQTAISTPERKLPETPRSTGIDNSSRVEALVEFLEELVGLPRVTRLLHQRAQIAVWAAPQ